MGERMKDFDAPHRCWLHGEKFINPKVTTKGSPHAAVAMNNMQTLWFTSQSTAGAAISVGWIYLHGDVRCHLYGRRTVYQFTHDRYHPRGTGPVLFSIDVRLSFQF
jgi:hypothetical protein